MGTSDVHDEEADEEQYLAPTLPEVKTPSQDILVRKTSEHPNKTNEVEVVNGFDVDVNDNSLGTNIEEPPCPPSQTVEPDDTTPEQRDNNEASKVNGS
jgi:hypothetical protein